MNTSSFMKMIWFVGDVIPRAHVGVGVAAVGVVVDDLSKRGDRSLFVLEMSYIDYQKV